MKRMQKELTAQVFAPEFSILWGQERVGWEPREEVGAAAAPVRKGSLPQAFRLQPRGRTKAAQTAGGHTESHQSTKYEYDLTLYTEMNSKGSNT